jgi:hypothetical protein
MHRSRPRQAVLRDLQYPGERDVAECERTGPPDRSRHVRHAVVDDILFDEGRRTMRRGTAGLETAPLIDGHIDQHAPGLHQSQIVTIKSRGALAPGIRTDPITRSASRISSE